METDPGIWPLLKCKLRKTWKLKLLLTRCKRPYLYFVPCPLCICHVLRYYKHSTKHGTATMQNFRRLLQAQFLITYKFKSFHLLEMEQYQLLYNIINYTYYHISPSEAAVYLNFKIVWPRALICWRHIRCCCQDSGWLKKGKQLTTWIPWKENVHTWTLLSI
jgi:hypothetical protein